MAKYISIFFLSFLSLTGSAFSQVKADKFTQEKQSGKVLTEVEKLSATARIWGFLKYYHPQVATGKFNWDEQLFAILPKVKNAKTSRDLSGIFSSWIDSLGAVDKCSSCNQVREKEVFNKNFDLSWIDSEIFSKELSAQLRYIENNRVQDAQHYVTKTRGAGNIVVQNEPEYENFIWEEKELRLLSLFRYWNQVEYFFPYKYQMDCEWDKTLKALLPLFLNAADEREYHLAMLQLTSSLNDSHGWFVTDHTNRHYGYYWAPVKLKMIDGKAAVTGFYDEAKAVKDDWQVGDVLTAVAGIPVPEIIAKETKYMTGSNDPARHRNIEITLLNGSNDLVEIEYLRDGKLQKKEISRYLKSEFQREKENDPKWKLLENKIGYINLGLLENEDVEQMMKDLKDTKALIFDIRNYPNGTLGAIAGKINSESKPFVKFTVPDLNYPGKFTWTESISIGEKNPNAYKGKIILLVNELTQSHAEFTAMALQTAPDVTTIGSQTSGADGNVSDIAFLGKFTTYMSGIGVFYPDGRETQRVGIIPDVEVNPTLEGIKEGRDEVLEKAIEVIEKKTS